MITEECARQKDSLRDIRCAGSTTTPHADDDILSGHCSEETTAC